MRTRWYILAAVAGGLAALAVWFWPQGPAWRSGPHAGELHGFSPDGRVLITVYAPHPEGGKWPNSVVSRWDAATGRLLSRAALACAEKELPHDVRTSPDGRIAVVNEDPLGSLSPKQREDTCYLHDAVTGERRAGPIPGLRSVAYRAFSADGRWFCGSLAPTDPKSPLTSSFGIFWADTGELLLKTPEEDGLMAMPVGRFAPDGATVAFYSLRFEPKGPRPRAILHVLELPSGRERCRIVTSGKASVELRSWDGRFLQVREYYTDPASDTTPIPVRIYDFGEDPVGEGVVDPLLSIEVARGGSSGVIEAQGGPNWVAYISRAAPAPPRTGLASWIVSWLGLQRAAPRGQPVTVRVVDRATGATRYEVPRPVGHPCQVSPDGRWLAGLTQGDSVEIWDLDPPPRWPKAAALGAAVAGGMLGLGWWRQRLRCKPRAA